MQRMNSKLSEIREKSVSSERRPSVRSLNSPASQYVAKKLEEKKRIGMTFDFSKTQKFTLENSPGKLRAATSEAVLARAKSNLDSHQGETLAKEKSDKDSEDPSEFGTTSPAPVLNQMTLPA